MSVVSPQILIMCGGGGTRLWPLSTPEAPKPYLNLWGIPPLLRQSFERALALTSRENIWVITTQDLASRTQGLLPDLLPKQLITEPSGRNTAPALAYAHLVMAKTLGDRFTCMVLSADHYIPDVTVFVKDAQTALALAEKGEALLTLGIKPSAPKTDYGYILKGAQVAPHGFRVDRFVEKPNLETARTYVAAQTYVWNSGMFVWRCDRFFKELSKHAPDILGALSPENLSGKDLSKVYSALPKISIDYALMEKSSRVWVCETHFAWSDLGTFDAVAEAVARDRQNGLSGAAYVCQGSGNLVLAQDKPVVLFGLDDMVVIQTAEVTLVTTRQRSTQLKELLDDAAFKQHLDGL